MKKYTFFLMVFLLPLFKLQYTFGQIDMITFPAEGTVFQKDNNNEHELIFAGQTNASLSLNVYYKILKRSSSGGPWTAVTSAINISPTWTSGDRKGFFINAGKFTKGWYAIKIYRRIFGMNIPVHSREIGVGDVYFVAGQSNASGYFDPPNDTTIPYYNGTSTNEAARVYSKSEFHNGLSSNSNERNDIKSGIPYPKPDDRKSFEIFRNGTSESDLVPIFPNGQASWAWAPLAQKIASEKNTPVIFFNVAYPGSSLRWNWTTSENSDLNRKMTKTLMMFGNILGTKAILWHQGEADNQNLGDMTDNRVRQYPVGDYSTHLNSLINWSRKPLDDETNKKISWYVSEVSHATGNAFWEIKGHTGPTQLSPSVISTYGITSKYLHEGLKQQQRNVLNASSRIYKGVVTDDNTESERDSWARIHFTGNSLQTLANEWYAAIYNNYHNDGVSPTRLVKLTNVVNSGINSYTLTVDSLTSGATYYWVRNDNGILNATTTVSNSYKFDNTNPDDFLSCYIMKDGRLAASQPFVVPGGAFQQKALNSSHDNFSFNGGVSSQEATVIAQNVIWEVSSVPSWVSYTFNEDENKLNFTTATNSTSGARSGSVILQEVGGGLSKTINIYQNVSGSSNTSLLTLSPTSGSFNTNVSNDMNTMQIGGVQYFQGLGVHADRTITYNLGSQYSTFFGKVGRDDEADNVYDSGKVQFVIKADGAVIWTSQVHGNNTSAEAFNVNVSGKNNLELIVNQLEDMNFDHADWVDLYLTTSGGGGCSTPTNPSNVSASASSITSGQSTTLSATCSVGTITWSTGQTGASVSVSPTANTTYQVSCVNGSCQSGTVPVSITVIPSGGGGACSAVSNNLTMGTWTVTGQPLVARYFHGQYWLTQKVSSSPDEFVVRGAAMLQRSDVSLSNSAYYNLINCFSWIYSDYGNLQVPNSSTFPTPAGYTLVYSQDGTPYYSASGAPPSGIVSGNCYKLRSLANNNYVQAMSGGAVQINGNNNQNDQKWKVESVGTSYKVTTMNGSGQVIKANSLTYSSGLVLGSFVSGNNYYYWNFENNAGNYRVSAPSNQYTWDHEGAGSGNHLQIYGTTSEQFIDYRLFAFEGTTCPAGLRVAAEAGVTEEEKTGYMNFAPNPTNGAVEVKVNLTENGEVNVSLTDFMGRDLESKTYQGTKGNNSFDFKAPNLPAGVYLLRVKSKGKIESKKIAIE
jgi:hypothetical protein